MDECSVLHESTWAYGLSKAKERRRRSAPGRSGGVRRERRRYRFALGQSMRGGTGVRESEYPILPMKQG